MSNKQKRVISGLLAVFWMATIFVLSHQPDLGGLGRLGRIPLGDKIIHAGAFGLLALFIYSSSQNFILAFLLTSLYGLGDELHQSFVPGRTADGFDWLADTVGAALALGWQRYIQQKRT